MFNRWATHGHVTRHYLQLLDESYEHQSLFIQLKLHTWHHKKGCKTPTSSGTTNKQGQLMTTTNNPQYATKNESLQLQVTKCPIYG
jgi:hypothetical protein